MRSSFVSSQCYSFMRYSTLRSLFVLTRNFCLFASLLCDFQLFLILIRAPIHTVSFIWSWSLLCLLRSSLISCVQFSLINVASNFAIFVFFLPAIVVYALLYSVENITFAIRIFIAILLSKHIYITTKTHVRWLWCQTSNKRR